MQWYCIRGLRPMSPSTTTATVRRDDAEPCSGRPHMAVISRNTTAKATAHTAGVQHSATQYHTSIGTMVLLSTAPVQEKCPAYAAYGHKGPCRRQCRHPMQIVSITNVDSLNLHATAGAAAALRFSARGKPVSSSFHAGSMAGLRVLIVGAGMTAAGAAKGILRRYPAADISVWEQVRHHGTHALSLLCSGHPRCCCRAQAPTVGGRLETVTTDVEGVECTCDVAAQYFTPVATSEAHVSHLQDWSRAGLLKRLHSIHTSNRQHMSQDHYSAVHGTPWVLPARPGVQLPQMQLPLCACGRHEIFG